MKTGLLWFDDDPQKRLEEKVQRAATHYERKYGAHLRCASFTLASLIVMDDAVSKRWVVWRFALDTRF